METTGSAAHASRYARHMMLWGGKARSTSFVVLVSGVSKGGL